MHHFLVLLAPENAPFSSTFGTENTPFDTENTPFWHPKIHHFGTRKYTILAPPKCTLGGTGTLPRLFGPGPNNGVVPKVSELSLFFDPFWTLKMTLFGPDFGTLRPHFRAPLY